VLDPKKTSPYKFYQFWINTADADVYRFLKFFTFMDIAEINALEEEDKNSGKAPRAQYVLAEQVTRLVHGEEGLVAAKRITESLFNGNLSDLSEADFEQLAQDGVPMIEMEKGADLMQALVDSELQPSRGQARKTIASNAVTINGEKQSDPEYVFVDATVCLVATPYCVAVRKITVWSAGSNCVKAGRGKPRPFFFSGNQDEEHPRHSVPRCVWPCRQQCR
jgi:tyrosyl-tRNA synthetase